MGRHKTSVFEGLVLLAGRLSWWVCILLAIVSYFVLHIAASRPPTPITSSAQFGDAIGRTFLSGVATTLQYLLPLIFAIGAVVSGITSMRRRKLYEHIESRSDIAVLNEISWQDFETLVGEYYRRNGFVITHEGSGGADGGVDLVLRRDTEMYLVQCKQWKAYKVGVQPVREFYGVMTACGAAGGYFVTSGTYTQEAQAFARNLNVELVDGPKLRKMIDAARRQPVVSPLREESPSEVVAPTCPKCGAEMKRRVARQGKYAGKEFWGCVRYPKCTGTRPLEET